ncbi:hypothetical protein HMPREF1212_00154 [Parabacteroides sp. HGS0025]|jgi:hypothetical protein|uniref:DUF4221 family protein n=1 Tax=Parabacteroides sp. HGS0025 TaxID=1078087 RepID=UPI0006173829|nr:DUF4221 family protein [Parabacteroides sp. HGS0025]KKB54441.1 hypothetical protein HMPREF1212_00154 [Parabacteroides sp. HGS0025]
MKAILLLYLSIFLFACNKENKRNVHLEKSGRELSLLLDSDTKSNTKSLFLYKNKTGKEYITFQNQFKNEIYFYNIENQKFEFKITPNLDGNNGVGMFFGYYIQNLDSIFLTNSEVEEIALIDSSAKLKEQLVYDKASDGTLLRRSFSTTNFFRPLTIIGNKIYTISRCNRNIHPNPVSITIDMKTKKVDYLPFEYPQIQNNINKMKAFGLEDQFSRVFDGNHFIYSFYFEEDIFVASIDHKKIQRKKVKSKYINSVRLLDDFGKSTIQEACENPNYGNMIYDPYRSVYYRIAFPEVEFDHKLEMNEAIELLDYGRKKFSIIILDKEFNIIGETLFPDYSYNPGIMFIREDGLYISTCHPMNPLYNDDFLNFQKFELKK